MKTNSPIKGVIPFRATALSLTICILVISAGSLCSQAVFSFSQHEIGGGSGGPDQVQGWEFIPLVDVTVLQLGLYDGSFNPATGFTQPHDVAIWDANRNLVISAHIPQGQSGILDRDFRFVDVPSTSLQSGQTYVIGAFSAGPVSDYTGLVPIAYRDQLGDFDPRIEFSAYRAGLSPGSITFPESRDVNYFGGFGPNFVIAVPEPSPLLLMCLAGCASLLCWRLRKTKSTCSLTPVAASKPAQLP